jgi:hypothetical protein
MFSREKKTKFSLFSIIFFAVNIVFLFSFLNHILAQNFDILATFLFCQVTDTHCSKAGF